MGDVAFTGASINEIICGLTSAHIATPNPRPTVATQPQAEPGPSDMITVEDVMDRYRLRDIRTARAVIREAGGKRIGGRWQVRRERLEAWEAQPDAADQLADGNSQSNHRRALPPAPTSARHALPPLSRDWLDDPTQEPRG